jgi:outer membrane protein assembly factor BamB
MFRLAWATAALTLLACALVAATPAGSDKYPSRIALPVPWSPEGMAIDKHTFYAGNTANGSIYAGDVRTGTGALLVPAAAGRSAYGIFPDHGRLWVAGGATGKAFVYDQETGELLAEYLLEPSAPNRINDVYVTKDAAYFTCGSVVCPGASAIYKVAIEKGHKLSDPSDPASVTKIPVAIPVRPGAAGARDGLNGIRGWDNDRMLVVGQTGTGKLWAVDPDTAATHEILLNEPVPTNDGMIVGGKIVYSVSNQTAGYIAAIRMEKDLSSGEVVAHLNSAEFPLRNPSTTDWVDHHLVYILARDNNNPAAPVALTRVDIPNINGQED